MVSIYTKSACKFLHQLYCSTIHSRFQHNFLIIVANFIIHTSSAFTHPYPVTIDDKPKKRPAQANLFSSCMELFTLYPLYNNKCTEILWVTKRYPKQVFCLTFIIDWSSFYLSWQCWSSSCCSISNKEAKSSNKNIYRACIISLQIASVFIPKITFIGAL